MANPNFDPQASSNTLWFGDQEDVCLTDVVDGKAEADHTHTGYAAAAHEHDGYADANHTHTGYAEANHEHTDYADVNHEHTEYADADHTHTGYAAANHEHTGYADANHGHTPAAIGAAPASHTHNYAAPTHTHAQGDITGLIASLSAKAEATHNHTLAEIVGLVAALAAKADLVDGKVPAAQLPGYVDDVIDGTLVNTTTFNVNGSAVTPEADKIYNDTTLNKSYRWSGSQFVPLNDGVALGETSATAYRGDRGKTAYNHSQNGDVHVTAAQKTAWNGKADGNHTHTPAGIGAAPASHTHDYAASGHTHAYSELTGKPTIPTIPASLPANGGNADTVGGMSSTDFATASHTHSGFATSGHNHDSAYIAKDLQFTADNGGVNVSVTLSSGNNLLTVISGLSIGVYTVYSQSGVAGNPKTTEAWRFMVHKTNSTVIWVLGFGSMGSVYSNYYSDNTWLGWRCLYDANPAPLWSGNYYMNAYHTVTPSKKLSECRAGWVLVWSDYDPDTNTVNNEDFVTTVLYKRKPDGTAWSGQSHYFDIPRYIGDTAADVTTESRIMKRLYVHDDKLVGYEYNNQSNARKDVVLRAIYEF